jgi:hypothetical protein
MRKNERGKLKAEKFFGAAPPILEVSEFILYLSKPFCPVLLILAG